MITEFEDFCTWVFVVVDDIWEQIAPFFKRPGPAPVCSDSELIAKEKIMTNTTTHDEKDTSMSAWTNNELTNIWMAFEAKIMCWQNWT
jgi:hypothetical protein